MPAHARRAAPNRRSRSAVPFRLNPCIAYLIYSNSAGGQPRAQHEFISAAQNYFDRWGSMQTLHDCVKELSLVDRNPIEIASVEHV